MSESRQSRVMNVLKEGRRTTLEILAGAAAGWTISSAFYEGSEVSGELAIIMGGYYDRMNNNAACAVVGGIALPTLTRVAQAAYRHYRNRAVSRNLS